MSSVRVRVRGMGGTGMCAPLCCSTSCRATVRPRCASISSICSQRPRPSCTRRRRGQRAPLSTSTSCRATRRPRCASISSICSQRPRPSCTRRRRGQRAPLSTSNSCRATRRPSTATRACRLYPHRRSRSGRSRLLWRQSVKDCDVRVSDEHGKSAEITNYRREGVRRAAYLAVITGLAHRSVRINLADAPLARLLSVALGADQANTLLDETRGSADTRRILLRTGEAPLTPAPATSRGRRGGHRHGGRRRRRGRLRVHDVFVLRQRPALARGGGSRCLSRARRAHLLAELPPLHARLFDPGRLVGVPQRLRWTEKINASGPHVIASETRTAVNRRFRRRSRKQRNNAGRDRVRTTLRIARFLASKSFAYLESRFSSLVSGSTVAAARRGASAGLSTRGTLGGRCLGSSSATSA